MQDLIVREYLGNTIQFKMVEGHIYANANKMAEGFGGSQKLYDWKNSSNTKRYIEALEKAYQKISDTKLIIVNQGGKANEQGTWIHEKLILNFARYLNVEFELWCDEQITTLLREGKVNLNQDRHSLEEKLILDVIYSNTKEEMALSMKTYRDKIVKPLMVENKKLENKVEEQKPHVFFAKSVEGANNSTLVGNMAKLITQSGYKIGQNTLFSFLRDNGYLIKRKGDSYNMPTQKSIDMGLFEIKERTGINPDGSIRVSKTPLVTGKGQIYFINLFKKIA